MIGSSISIWGNGNPVPVLTFGAIATLYVGVSATITISVLNAEGQTATITVDGETWGSGTVSGGSVAVTATPTSAMAGSGVAVVATVGCTTASTTADVLVRSITFVSVPTLYVGVSGTISGTAANSNGLTLTMTVDGESFGTATVTAGAWSITATPSSAMAGAGVAVVATVTGATESTTANVLVRTITFGVLPNIYVATGTGITYAITGTTANVPDGTNIPITVNGQTWGTGTVTSNAFSVAATPSDAMANLTAAVVATVPGATQTGAIRCLGPSLFAGVKLDLRRKLDYSLAPAIQTWGDLSGGNHDFSALAEARQPADGVNGPDFSGDADPNGDYLVNSTLGAAIGTVSNLVAAVSFKLGTVAQDRGIFQIYNLPAYTGIVFSTYLSNALRMTFGAAASFAYRDGVVSDSNSHVAMIRSASLTATCHLDGVQIGTSFSVNPFTVAGSNTYVGTYKPPGFYLDGSVANVIVSTDSSAGNVALIQEWLMAVKP